MTRNTSAGVTSRTKAPRKGTPAYALWLEERRAMNESLVAEFDRHVALPLVLRGYPRPQVEFRFHPQRDWRYDRYYAAARLVIDLDGGAWMRDPDTGELKPGSHNTPQGRERDRVKDCEAVCLGLRVLRLSPQMIESGRALEYVERALRATHTNTAA